MGLDRTHLAGPLEGDAFVNKERRRMQIADDLCGRVNLNSVCSTNICADQTATNDHRAYFYKVSFNVSTFANNEGIFTLDAAAKVSLYAHAALEEELAFETRTGSQEARDFRGILHGTRVHVEVEPEDMCAFVLQNATKYIAFGDFAAFASWFRVLLTS
jgi:hypothetical protein